MADRGSMPPGTTHNFGQLCCLSSTTTMSVSRNDKVCVVATKGQGWVENCELVTAISDDVIEDAEDTIRDGIDRLSDGH